MLKRIFTVTLVLIGLSGCELIQDQLDGNQAPVISALVPDPTEGNVPLLVGFSWEIADIEGDVLTCTLSYGNGEEQQIDNCAQVTDTFYTFYEPGGYAVELRVDDGLNSVVSSVAIGVLEAGVSGFINVRSQITSSALE